MENKSGFQEMNGKVECAKEDRSHFSTSCHVINYIVN